MNSPITGCGCKSCRAVRPLLSMTFAAPAPVKNRWVIENENGEVWVTAFEYTRSGIDEQCKMFGNKAIGVFTPAAVYASDPLPTKPEPKRITAADLKTGMTFYFRESKRTLMEVQRGEHAGFHCVADDFKSKQFEKTLDDLAARFNGIDPLYTLEPR